MERELEFGHGAGLVGPPLDPVYQVVFAMQRPGVLQQRLAESWVLAPGRRVSAARLRQINYKPYDRARLVAEVTVTPQCARDEPVVQVIFIAVYETVERASANYLTAAQQRPRPSLGPPVILLEDWRAVVWSLPNEPRLGTIQFCFDPAQFAHFLTEHSLGTADSTAYLPQLLRYVPRRRALFYVAANGNRPAFYLKVYKQSQYASAADNLRMLTEAAVRGDLGFKPPQLVAHCSRLRTVVMTEVPGVPLTERLVTATPELFAETGRILAALHGSGVNPTDVWTAEREVKALMRAMEDVTAAQPALIPDLNQVLQQISSLKDSLEFCSNAPIHANLFGDQILCDSQHISIVDWDDLAWGDPLFDVGRLIAHLMYAVHASRVSPAYLAGLIGALLNAYAQDTRWAVDKQGLRWHIAVALLLRAKISALRALPATWIEDLRWSLAEAQHVLNGQSTWLPRSLSSVQTI